MNLRTPLARVRGLGLAKGGVHHWKIQRLTAIILIPLSLWFIYSLVAITGADYQTTKAWLGNIFNVSMMLLFILFLYYHATLGIQVIIEDYLDSPWKKIVCLILIKYLACFASLSTAIAVLKIYLEL